MSKGIKFDRCRECEHYLDILETYDRKPRYWCSELKKYIVGDGSTIHPDCPLPDWPSVKRTNLRKFAGQILYTEGASSIEGAAEVALRSIGVEIVEENKEK